MKKQTFIIIGGKWFDKINGNTYHNAKIINCDGVIHYSGFQYGYGSQYMTSATEYIKNILKIKNFNLIDGGSFYIKKSILKNNWF